MVAMEVCPIVDGIAWHALEASPRLNGSCRPTVELLEGRMGLPGGVSDEFRKTFHFGRQGALPQEVESVPAKQIAVGSDLAALDAFYSLLGSGESI